MFRYDSLARLAVLGDFKRGWRHAPSHAWRIYALATVRASLIIAGHGDAEIMCYMAATAWVFGFSYYLVLWPYLLHIALTLHTIALMAVLWHFYPRFFHALGWWSHMRLVILKALWIHSPVLAAQLEQRQRQADSEVAACKARVAAAETQLRTALMHHADLLLVTALAEGCLRERSSLLLADLKVMRIAQDLEEASGMPDVIGDAVARHISSNDTLISAATALALDTSTDGMAEETTPALSGRRLVNAFVTVLGTDLLEEVAYLEDDGGVVTTPQLRADAAMACDILIALSHDRFGLADDVTVAVTGMFQWIQEQHGTSRSTAADVFAALGADEDDAMSELVGKLLKLVSIALAPVHFAPLVTIHREGLLSLLLQRLPSQASACLLASLSGSPAFNEAVWRPVAPRLCATCAAMLSDDTSSGTAHARSKLLETLEYMFVRHTDLREFVTPALVRAVAERSRLAPSSEDGAAAAKLLTVLSSC